MRRNNGWRSHVGCRLATLIQRFPLYADSIFLIDLGGGGVSILVLSFQIYFEHVARICVFYASSIIIHRTLMCEDSKESIGTALEHN